jgi:dGTPase
MEDKEVAKLLHFKREEHAERERRIKELGLVSLLYTLASESKGRLRPEDESGDWRDVFVRDRNRIAYSHAFRRLRNKAQVVAIPVEQHLTTRLPHTIEVEQMAEGICYFLLINRDLARAIALGHDLGHTPFGHAGESVKIPFKGFCDH